jgi:hypothetical protein
VSKVTPEERERILAAARASFRDRPLTDRERTRALAAVARAQTIESPALTKFRADIRVTKTSELLALEADVLIPLLGVSDKTPDDVAEALVAAALLAIAAEIDRRIPVPQ